MLGLAGRSASRRFEEVRVPLIVTVEVTVDIDVLTENSKFMSLQKIPNLPMCEIFNQRSCYV